MATNDVIKEKDKTNTNFKVVERYLLINWVFDHELNYAYYVVIREYKTRSACLKAKANYVYTKGNNFDMLIVTELL